MFLQFRDLGFVRLQLALQIRFLGLCLHQLRFRAGYPTLVFTNLRQFAGNLRFPILDTFCHCLTLALGRFALIVGRRHVVSQCFGFAAIQNAEHG